MYKKRKTMTSCQTGSHQHALYILEKLKTTKSKLIQLKGPNAMVIYNCMKHCLKFRQHKEAQHTLPLFRNMLEIEGSYNIKQQTLEQATVCTFQGKRSCLVLILCEDKLTTQQIQFIKRLSHTLPILFICESQKYIPNFQPIAKESYILPCGINSSTYMLSHLRKRDVKYLRCNYASSDIISNLSVAQTGFGTIEDLSDLDIFMNHANQRNTTINTEENDIIDVLLDKTIESHGTIHSAQMPLFTNFKKHRRTNETTLKVINNTMTLNNGYSVSTIDTITTLDYLVFNAEQKPEFNREFRLFKPYRDVSSRQVLCSMNERCREFAHFPL